MSFRCCRLFLALLIFACASPSMAQSTVKVMHYNLLYYGNTDGCTESDNNTNNKDTYLKTIFQYIYPDIFTVNELGAGTFANRILQNVINTGGISYYAQAASTGNGSKIVNMLYYDSRKFTLHSQEQIEKDLQGNNLTRLIDVYKLYYNDPDLPVSQDTVFIRLIVAHLKAGSAISDQNKREKETEAIMNYINIKSELGENYLMIGDLNVQSSTEMSFDNLINHYNTAIRFYDPIDRLGAWNNTSTFQDIHTQSTHTSGTCFQPGGMDDRFDFILASGNIINYTKNVGFVSGSYRALGQDGGNFNTNLNFTTNQAVPNNIAEALYKMSDHLPVLLSLEINKKPASVSEESAENSKIIFNNPFTGDLSVWLLNSNISEPYFELHSIFGKLISTKKMTKENNGFHLKESYKNLPDGMYILKITDGKRSFVNKKLIKTQ